MLISLLVLYIIFCGSVYFFPEYFFYKPSSKKSDINKAREGGFLAEEVNYYASDGTEELAWFVKPRNDKKVILFFHGNAHNLESFYYKLLSFAEDGYGIFMPEYRGFGGQTGKITQKNLEQDALAAIHYLRGQGYKNENIIVYGLSLGSHMAINTVYELQSKGDFAGLVLEVPFNNIVETAKAVVKFPFPYDLIIKDKYENREMIGKINTPILIQGGRQDKLVPVKLAEDLYKYAQEPKKIEIYEDGTHNGLYRLENYNSIKKWLEENK